MGQRAISAQVGATSPVLASQNVRNALLASMVRVLPPGPRARHVLLGSIKMLQDQGVALAAALASTTMLMKQRLQTIASLALRGGMGLRVVALAQISAHFAWRADLAKLRHLASQHAHCAQMVLLLPS